MITKHLISWLCLVAVLCFSSKFVCGATIFSDDFESGTLTKWDTPNISGDGIVELESTITAGGSYALHLKSPSVTDMAGIRSSIFDNAIDLNSKFHIEFDVYIPGGVFMQTWYLFEGWDPRGPDLVFRWSEDHRESTFDYTFDYYDGSGWHELTNSNIVTATWTKIYLDASGDGTYEVHIGNYDNYIGTFDLNSGTWSRFFLGDGNTESYSGEMYIDNILITDTYIPEPVTLSIVAGGLLMMQLRRRK